MAGLLLVGLADRGWRMPVLFLLGMALGAVLLLASFGFTSGYREFLLKRDAAGVRAQLLMLALTTMLFAPVLAAGSAFGQPVTGAVAPVGVQVAAGAFLFGIGMQLAGGCGSGALFGAGGGSARMLIVLFFFAAGSFWASLHMPWWEGLPAAGPVSIADGLGWPLAVALQVGVLSIAWVLAGRVPTRGVNAPADTPRMITRWRMLLRGAVALGVLNALTLVIAGHPWTITWAFALWGAKVATLFGWDPATAPFWSGDFQRDALGGSVLAAVTSVMNIGILLGAWMAAAGSGRFALRFAATRRGLAAAVLGGIAMGYGARIAYGCNIGAFFSGVASTSLHGWLWIAAALAGNWVGVRLRPRFGLAN
jgi:hypothetical protein